MSLSVEKKVLQKTTAMLAHHFHHLTIMWQTCLGEILLLTGLARQHTRRTRQRQSMMTRCLPLTDGFGRLVLHPFRWKPRHDEHYSTWFKSIVIHSECVIAIHWNESPFLVVVLFYHGCFLLVCEESMTLGIPSIAHDTKYSYDYIVSSKMSPTTTSRPPKAAGAPTTKICQASKICVWKQKRCCYPRYCQYCALNTRMKRPRRLFWNKAVDLPKVEPFFDTFQDSRRHAITNLFHIIISPTTFDNNTTTP